MARYLLIESRGPFPREDFCYGLAADLARAGNDVTLFLVQNGVLAARAGARAEGMPEAASAGVRLLADDFSLRERGIDRSRLVTTVSPASIDTVIDALAGGQKVLWH